MRPLWELASCFAAGEGGGGGAQDEGEAIFKKNIGESAAVSYVERRG